MEVVVPSLDAWVGLPVIRRRLLAIIFLLWFALPASLPWAGLEALAAPSAEAGAEKVYINVRRANVRDGPGPEHKALRVMSAGQELEAIGSKGNWLKVKLGDGKTGWVNKRAVTRKPPAKVVIAQLRSQLKAAQQDNETLKQEITRLSDARQDLELENSRLKAKVSVLTLQNEDLKSWRVILWAAVGLVVLLVGWALGFLTGMLRKQADDRRYDRLMRDAGTKKV